MRDSCPMTSDELQQQLTAIDIDVRCSLAFSRAILKGMAASSAQARHILDVALDEELSIISEDSSEHTAAVHGIVSEARAQLRQVSNLQNRLTSDLERAILETAAALHDDEDPEERQGRRCA